MDYLARLESETVYILREAVAQFRRPVLLFSGGKDSACLVRLAQKAFRPARLPFPLLHIDTGHNFRETLDFRDGLVRAIGERLIVRRVEDSIRAGRAAEPEGARPSRNALQSVTLLDAIAEFGFDAVIGGARRDEEKSRAKERVFSIRDAFGRWDARNQRPELWNLYNGRIRSGEHMRIFPLSNWTELDIWRYVRAEKLSLPVLYFSHRRKCVRKGNGLLLAHCRHVPIGPHDEVAELDVRCRTVGDMTCTGLIPSTAADVETVLGEVAAARTSERESRADDKVSDMAMEDRKRRGYF